MWITPILLAHLLVGTTSSTLPGKQVKPYESAESQCASVGSYLSTNPEPDLVTGQLWLALVRRRHPRWIWTRDATFYANRNRQLLRPKSNSNRRCVRIRAGDEVSLDDAACNRPLDGGAICSGRAAEAGSADAVPVTLGGHVHHVVIIRGRFDWFQASTACSRLGGTLASNDILAEVSNQDIYQATQELIDGGSMQQDASYWIGLVAEAWYNTTAGPTHADVLTEYHWCAGQPEDRYTRAVLDTGRGCWVSVSRESSHGYRCAPIGRTSEVATDYQVTTGPTVASTTTVEPNSEKAQHKAQGDARPNSLSPDQKPSSCESSTEFSNREITLIIFLCIFIIYSLAVTARACLLKRGMTPAQENYSIVHTVKETKFGDSIA